MLYSERQATRRYSDTYLWSPELSKAISSYRYWTLLLKKAKGYFVRDSTLLELQWLANLNPECIPASLNIRDMARWLTESKQALKDLQSKHVVLRENHLATLAEARFLARKPSILEPGRIHLLSKRIETEIKCIRKRERIRHLHKLIGQALAPSNHSNGLQRVNIPATKTDTPYPAGPDPKTLDGPWRSITSPTLMAHHICAVNHRQYNQALPPPPASGKTH